MMAVIYLEKTLVASVMNFCAVVMRCSMADCQWSFDRYCLVDKFCCLCSDLRGLGAGISAIKLEKTTLLLLFGCCHHVYCRLVAAAADLLHTGT